MVSYCPECGKKVEGSPRFCPDCGNQLSMETEPTKKTPVVVSLPMCFCAASGNTIINNPLGEGKW